MSITDNLDKVFGVDKQVAVVEDTKEIKKSLVSVHKEDDVNLARNLLVELLHKSNDLLDESIVLAKESQSPRAFEVSGTLIKTIAEVAQDLISIHEEKTKSGSSTKTGKVETMNATQNNIYIGSTADLTKMLKDATDSLGTVDLIHEGEIVDVK